MIPDTTLPLLDPLQLIPFNRSATGRSTEPGLVGAGEPGYGDVADNYLGGWSQGDADVPTTLGFLPSTSVLEQVPQALVNGLEQGITDALKDLTNPGNYVYTLPSWVDELVKFADALPGTEFQSSHRYPRLSKIFSIPSHPTPASRLWT